MVDRFGLLTDGMPNLLPFQTRLVQKRENLKNWDTDNEVLSLLDVVRNVKPDILIGVSGQTGLFTEEIIREMHKHCERPIVMPLSNPTSRVEATPQDIIAWTEGNALVATGSPFDIHKVSRAIAFAVGKMAQQQGVAVKTSADALQQAIDDNFWMPEYRSYRRTSI